MEERLGFVVLANPSVVCLLFPVAKHGSVNNPLECAGFPDTEVYDECCG